MKKSIRNIAYALIDEEVSGAITYGAIKYLETTEAGGRAYTLTPKGEFQRVYANGIVAYAADNNCGYDVDLILLALIDVISQEWYGNTLTNGKYKGVAEYADAPVPPKFCLIIHEDTTDGEGSIIFLPYCQVNSRQTRSGKTSEEGPFDFAFSEHKILASPRPTDMMTKFEFAGKEKLTAVPEPTAPVTEPENQG